MTRLDDALRLLLATPGGAALQYALAPAGDAIGDAALAWVLARVAFALGPPGARLPADPATVAAAQLRVRELVCARSRTYVRVGDPQWFRYAVVGLWPVNAEGDGEDRALLLRVGRARPDQYTGATFRIAEDYSACWHLDSVGREWAYSPWPPEYAPPLVRQLASDRKEDWGEFIPEECAVPGDAYLLPDVRTRVGT